MNSIKVCEYSWSRSFHDDLILQDQASGERSQDQWSSGFFLTDILGHLFDKYGSLKMIAMRAYSNGIEHGRKNEFLRFLHSSVL